MTAAETMCSDNDDMSKYAVCSQPPPRTCSQLTCVLNLIYDSCKPHMLHGHYGPMADCVGPGVQHYLQKMHLS